MQNRAKRWIAGTLSGAMLFGCMPSAFAAAAQEPVSNVQPELSYRNVLSNAPNAQKLDAKQTYDQVLDLYESYFQNSVRFTQDGAQADITGKEWFDDIETVGINRERAKTQFIPYDDAEKAFAAEKSVLDEVGANTSPYYKKLSGTEWEFALVDNPAEAEKKDKEWLSKDYTGKDFQKEYVPASWQTYRNPDGTFKYDEPMYTNHGFPWADNLEKEDYVTPQAPTEKNPVGYYRTSFTLDEGWKNRETFISLQSVESAYYLYVNGKPVGYSTDSFTAHDFNITPYLQDGENTIALKVFRWSIGSWLENQDFIRQSGIYRDVYLYSKGEAEVRDYFAKTEFTNPKDLVNSDVKLNLETTIRGLKNTQDKNYKVSVRLRNQNGDEVARAQEQSVLVKAAGKTSAEKLRDAGTTITSTMTVTNPDKWFPDTPNLYYLEIVLSDENGKAMESIVERIGFRDLRKVRTEKKNADGQFLEQLQINGKQMVLRGVNRHDADVEKGHAVGYQEYLTDLTTMKQHNLNAIRTAHYPNDSVMYDLADELGLYICMDANIESHRAAFTGARVPTGPKELGEYKEWVAPVLDRNANMIEHYKNNPSVVIWSSNNEAQYAKVPYNSHSCFWVASMYALKRDPSRFRKSERASAYQEQVQTGDPWSLESRIQNIVDLHSTQYALPGGVNAYNNVQPYVHSEYDHAMGQSYGNAKEHWDVIRNRDNVNGGFIWDYIDQSIRTVNRDDTSDEFWGYGGDWIDKKYNDNAFCGNGLVYADHTPSPKLKEAKKVHQQVNFYLANPNVAPTDTVTVKMVNEYENTPLSAFDITWSIYQNSDSDKPLAKQTVTSNLGAMQGLSINTNSEEISIDLASVLPDFAPVSGNDYFLDFSVKLKENVNWGAKAGFEVAHEQFELDFTERTEQPSMDIQKIPAFESVEEKGSNVILTGTTNQKQKFEIVLNQEKGTIDSYKLDGQLVMAAGPEQSIYRAQTYNDTTAYWDEKSQNAGAPDRLSEVQVKLDTDSNKNKVTMSMTGRMQVDAAMGMSYEIYGNGEIVVLDQFSPKSDFAKEGGLAKVGSRMIVNSSYDNFQYYGRGPWDTYVDRESAARIGVYQNKVSDSFDKKMLKPQENGNHTDVRWTSLTNDEGTGLLVSTNGTIEVSALPYTAEELNRKNYNEAQYRHPNKVPTRQDSIVWNIDYKQRGVSDTAFMGHTPLDGYQVPTNQDYSYSYRITPITGQSEIAKISNEKYRVEAAADTVKSISVNGKPVEGFSSEKTEYDVTIDAQASAVEITAEGSNIEVVDRRNGTFAVSGKGEGGSQTYVVKVTRAVESSGYRAADAQVSLAEAAPLVDGKAEPVPVVKTADGKLLIDGVDFVVEYEGNTEAGKTAVATIQFKGAYHGDAIVKEFTVGDQKTVMRTIDFQTDGGTEMQSMQLADGTLLKEKEIPQPTKSGYTFAGWWNYNFTQAFDFNQPIAQDTTLYAKWTEDAAGAEKPEQKPVEKPEQKPAEKPEQKPTEKPEQKPTEKPEQKPAEKPEQKPVEKPEQKPAEKPEQKPTAAVKTIDTVAGKPESVAAYTDLKTHWAKDAIAWTVTNKLFVGAYPTQFEPDHAMTRGMLVTVLYRLAGQPTAGQSTFTDIPADAYYKDAVAWASGLDLVAGIGNGKFAPDENVTCGQLVKILHQFVGGTADSADTIVWAEQEGLLSDMPEGTDLKPENEATRAQVASMLMRLQQKKG